MSKQLAEVKQMHNVITFPTRPRLRCTCPYPSGVHFSNVGWICNHCLLPAKEGC